MKATDHPELFAERATLDNLVAQWHTGVSRAIVESWKFPESICIGVDEQELKERDRIGSADLSDILFISNIIARTSTKAARELGDLDALARLKLEPDALADMLEENEEEIQSMAEALSG